jgi:hypothetical protein
MKDKVIKTILLVLIGWVAWYFNTIGLVIAIDQRDFNQESYYIAFTFIMFIITAVMFFVIPIVTIIQVVNIWR